MSRVRVLCLGEALVDLICEQPAASLVDAPAFVPHPGGATANVCVTAARHGGSVALAGGAGDDPWGRWLRDELAREGVSLGWFSLVEDAATALAFVTVDESGEPEFLIYGGGIDAAIAAVAPDLPEAVEACDALFFASNTLVGDDERAVTLAARERALELGRPVVFDPNLRLHRWSNPGRAASVSRECLPGLFLLKCNRAEAQMLSGEPDPERAAKGLLAAGVQHVLITLGADGAILRGPIPATAPGVEAKVLNATGAGDAVAGVILARLSQAGFYPAAMAAALPEAVAAGAKATERWGAV